MAADSDATGAQTGTQTPGAKTATDAGEGKTSTVPYERFEGVIAERNRWKEKAEAAEAKAQKVAEEHKSEDEKRIDLAAKKVAEERYKPVEARVGSLESFLKSDLEAALAQIPEAHRGAVDKDAPVEVQLRQARAIISARSEVGGRAISSGGGNPQDTGSGTTSTKRISRSDYDKWTQSVYEGDKGRAFYYEHKEEYTLARKEGRVDGFPNSR